MLEIVKAGGWLMVPIVACSVVAVAIFFERLWTLQRKRVVPGNLTTEIWELVKHNQLDSRQIARVAQSSPLGQVLAAGLAHRHAPREVIKESIEDSGRHVVFELEALSWAARHDRGDLAAAWTARHGVGHDSRVHRDHRAGRRQPDGSPRAASRRR